MTLLSTWLYGLIKCTRKNVGHTSLNNCVLFNTVFDWQLVTMFVTDYFKSKNRWSRCLAEWIGQIRISDVSWCDIAHMTLQNNKNCCKTMRLQMEKNRQTKIQAFSKKNHMGIHINGPMKWVIGIVLDSCVMSTIKKSYCTIQTVQNG